MILVPTKRDSIFSYHHFLIPLVSSNQLNQKLKLIVEVLRYVIYSTLFHMRILWAISVDTVQILFIYGAKYCTLFEILLKFWDVVKIQTHDTVNRYKARHLVEGKKFIMTWS